LKSRKKKPKKRKTGLPPGTVVYTGSIADAPSYLDVLQYNETNFEEVQIDPDQLPTLVEPSASQVLWLDLRGVHNTEIITQIGRFYEIHPLILEDIADIHQRPKFDEYESGLLLVIPSLSWSDENNEVVEEQVSIYFNQNLVFSSQEKPEDLFIGVKERLREARGKIRIRKSDYLSYILVDQIVDGYYHLLDKLHDRMDQLEEELNHIDNNNFRIKIHFLKNEYLKLRRALMPMKEVVSRLTRSDNAFINPATKPYMRDLYDHTLQISEQIEVQREVLYSIQELHMSEISFKMNKVMQMLTVITTIFVPLTFLAGIYGMNFQYMPELEYKYAYHILLAAMLTLGLSLLYLFKKNKWL
jgi:magnesium transporter